MSHGDSGVVCQSSWEVIMCDFWFIRVSCKQFVAFFPLILTTYCNYAVTHRKRGKQDRMCQQLHTVKHRLSGECVSGPWTTPHIQGFQGKLLLWLLQTVSVLPQQQHMTAVGKLRNATNTKNVIFVIFLG